MAFTRPLRAPPPRHPLEIVPLARLDRGRLDLTGPAFPPLARVVLALWQPGVEPAFSLVTGRIHPGWRWEGPPAHGWVVAWSLLSVGDPAEPF